MLHDKQDMIKLAKSNIGFLQNKMQRTFFYINSKTLKLNIIWYAELQATNDYDKEWHYFNNVKPFLWWNKVYLILSNICHGCDISWSCSKQY